MAKQKRKRSSPRTTNDRSTPTERYENPVEQHADIWHNEFPTFLEEIKDYENTNTKLDACFAFIKEAQRFGRLPRIYIPDGLPYGPGDATLEECDVVYLSEALATEFLLNPLCSNKVIVIRDPRAASRWPTQTVDIQDFGQPLGEVHCSRRCEVGQILEDLKDPNPRLTPENPPRNLLDLAPRNCFYRPTCLTSDRFTILNELLFEEQCHARNSISKQPIRRVGVVTTGRENKEDIHLNFAILGQAYASSGFHKDSSGFGAFIRCVFGIKLWPILTTLNIQQSTRFEVEGEKWIPEDDHSVPIVSVFPGDTLIMLAGNANVHGPITLQNCYMEGGNFWDDKRLLEILGQIKNEWQNPITTNEYLPFHLRGIVQAIYRREQFYNRIPLQALCLEILRIFGFCECKSQCSKQCKCKREGRLCTAACTATSHSHRDCVMP
ncbi:uncharacterized protein PAC_18301 [Phialocephala subalpina]|uniref:JmjC domain-containing protein n=1 Tax=Phialocephala subalpina TaxID=576137 RepID=A0A1L7XTQ1_9HELO|nr:uncharacterized protein PAC_18301 [Phialocephala subalpina]